MIEVTGIHKAFGKDQVLQDITFSLTAHATLAILGRSGCGKTTLLKILAGLLSPDQGAFSVDGQSMLNLPPQHRGVVYLSQEPLLFPHLNVFENVAFGLRVTGHAPQVVKERVTQLLAQLGLEQHATKPPQALSGGQRQRVAFGRAIIIRPRILLLDEPFGSLDAQTREEMQQLFLDIRDTHRITSLFVTHDLREAITVGNTFARMDRGRIQIFPDTKALLQAPDPHIAQELAFWRNIHQLHDSHGNE